MARTSGRRIGEKAGAWAIVFLTVLYLSVAVTPYGDEVDYWAGIVFAIGVALLSVLALRDWWAGIGKTGRGIQSGRLRRGMDNQR